MVGCSAVQTSPLNETSLYEARVSLKQLAQVWFLGTVTEAVRGDLFRVALDSGPNNRESSSSALETGHEYPDNQPRAQHIRLLDCS
jgi:hypothetical protein